MNIVVWGHDLFYCPVCVVSNFYSASAKNLCISTAFALVKAFTRKLWFCWVRGLCNSLTTC